VGQRTSSAVDHDSNSEDAAATSVQRGERLALVLSAYTRSMTSVGWVDGSNITAAAPTQESPIKAVQVHLKNVVLPMACIR